MKKLYFIGICGVSMHALAIYFKNKGYSVCGSDKLRNENYSKLRKNKIKVYKRNYGKILKSDVIIKNGAIKDDDSELNFAIKNGKMVIDRGDLLNILCKDFDITIAVAGTHGKTTTSAMIYHILKECGESVSCHIGGEVEGAKLEFGNKYLVLEACEFNKTFLKLVPTISVVLNIEKEHMDCYTNILSLKQSFLKFLKVAELKFVCENRTTNFIKKQELENIEFVKEKSVCLDNCFGKYNIANASVAIAVCRSLGISESDAIEKLRYFKNVSRRQQYIGDFDNKKIYIDYAHHSTEVYECITAFNDKFKDVLFIFQPHTYSRTKLLFNEYVKLFSKIKNLIIFKEYPARESESAGYSAKRLYSEVKQNNKTVSYAESYKDLLSIITKLPQKTACFIGAGDIDLIAKQLVLAKKH